MAEESENNVLPERNYKFKVSFTTASVTFFVSEVNGFDDGSQNVKFRHGASTIKIPGSQKYHNVTLKRGIIVGSKAFNNWFAKIQANTIPRDTVTVELLDAHNAVTVQWTLNNAWPTKVNIVDHKSDGNEAAIESIEIAFESLIIINSKP